MKRNTNDVNERDDETKRPRSLSAASIADAQQANQDWLLANQQRLQAQSEALAAATGGQPLPGREEQPARLAAFESAQNQWAAALIRQRQAEETLLQCQQQQAAAAAEYLQQQAVAAINLQQGANLLGVQEGTSTTNRSSLPQGFGGSSPHVNVDQVGAVFSNQAISSLPGMFGSDERIYPRIPIEGFSNSNEAAAASPTAASLGSGLDFNVQSIGSGYPSLLLSSTPVPLNSHLAPVQPTGVTMPKKQEQPPKSKRSKKLTGTRVSIAGPKRRPVSLQSLVNRGEACYDPGPVRELALPSDHGNLSEYQCLLRKQIVLFAVSINDIQCSAQGRNKPIVLGQVGVLCRHCARIPPGMRPCGASYFPGKLSGLYQVSVLTIVNIVDETHRWR